MKLSGVAAGTAALGGLLSGCGQVTSAGDGAKEGKGSAKPDNHVVLGYWGGTCEAPIYIGIEKATSRKLAWSRRRCSSRLM